MAASSSSSTPDFLQLAKSSVQQLENLVRSQEQMLNGIQCRRLSSTLLRTVHNVEKMLVDPGASFCYSLGFPLRLPLINFYRIAEKAKLLVKNCYSEDWCQAAANQIKNEEAFREILFELGLCYSAIYDQAKEINSGDVEVLDLRRSSAFKPPSVVEVLHDQQHLYKRLEVLANLPIERIPGGLIQKVCLAKQLLGRLNGTLQEGETEDEINASMSSYVENVDVPSYQVWGESHYLGTGTTDGGVCKTTWFGIPCAKKLFKRKVIPEQFRREARILASLNHPNIVKFFSCGNDRKRECFIAMELMEKSLQEVIDELVDDHEGGSPFSLPVAIDVMLQIAYGMCYLHDNKVAHRDLKPGNVVVSALTSPHLGGYYSVKLVDFGLAKTKVRTSMSDTLSTPGVGTTLYRAPEASPQGSLRWIACKGDVYSFALTSYQILSGKTPFGNVRPRSALYDEIKSGLRPQLPSSCPKQLTALIKECWATDYHRRPLFTEICRRLEIFRGNLRRGPPGYSQWLYHKVIELSDQYIHRVFEERTRFRASRNVSCDVEGVGHTAKISSHKALLDDMSPIFQDDVLGAVPEELQGEYIVLQDTSNKNGQNFDSSYHLDSTIHGHTLVVLEALSQDIRGAHVSAVYMLGNDFTYADIDYNVFSFLKKIKAKQSVCFQITKTGLDMLDTHVKEQGDQEMKELLTAVVPLSASINNRHEVDITWIKEYLENLNLGRFKCELQELLVVHASHIKLPEFLKVYKYRYARDLNLQSLGVDNLESLFQKVQDVAIISDRGSQGYVVTHV